MATLAQILLITFMSVGWLTAQERVPTPNLEAPPLDAEHQVWQQVLERVVTFPAGVDYLALYRDHGDLDRYREQLAKAELPKDRAAQLAFWINAYNAVTLDLVRRTIPDPVDDAATPWKGFSVLTSVKDFWTAYHFQVAGEWLSIDEIQKKKLAALNEPRIHFAINCASVSCPPLLAEAYTADRLEAQLDRVTRAFVADEEQVRIQTTGWTGRGRSATLNPLVNWYRADFGGDDDKVRGFLVRHASEERAADLARAALIYGEYDWNLNIHPKRAE